MSLARADRIAGCLIGEAIGDAVAAPFESVDAYSIYKDYGGAARIVRDRSITPRSARGWLAAPGLKNSANN